VRRSVDIALVRGPDDSGGSARMPLPPLGMLHVAAALEQAGWRVAVVDAAGEGLDESGFLQRLRTLRPEVIGLSGMTPMRHLIARDLRRIRPLCEKVVLGGVHATRFQQQALDELPGVDALVIGEGEAPAGGLMSWWSGGGHGAPPPESWCGTGPSWRPQCPAIWMPSPGRRDTSLPTTDIATSFRPGRASRR